MIISRVCASLHLLAACYITVKGAPMTNVAFKNPEKVWSDRIIPYVIHDGFPLQSMIYQNLLKAMAEIEKKSCLKFRPRETQTDYIFIEKTSRGSMCWSHLGRLGGKQLMGINESCSRRDIIHELLHALGFDHEHQRPDRDDYITVLIHNVKFNERSNFKISPDIPTRTPYDKYSILHYRSRDSSVNGKPTILNKDGSEGKFSSDSLSPIDAWKINDYYRCNITKCESPGIPDYGILYAHDVSIGEKVVYRCEPGFTRVGSVTRKCEFDIFNWGSQWSGEVPICKKNTILYCDFESEDICGWSQLSLSELKWTRFPGKALTDGTGPIHDHTLRTNEGFDYARLGKDVLHSHYMLLDSTDGEAGDTARLRTTLLPRNKVYLTFYLNMDGTDCGIFRVNILEGNSEENLETIDGCIGHGWQIHQHTLFRDEPFLIEFEAVRGRGRMGDIAIDDVLVELITDNAGIGEPVHTKGSSNIKGSYVIGGCDFDDGGEKPMCDFYNGISMNKWTVTSAGEEGKNRYAVAKYTNDRTVSTEEIARLQLDISNEERTGVSAMCLRFSYNFLDVGKDVYTSNADLQVWISESPGPFKVWNSFFQGTKDGNWINKVIEISLPSRFKLTFEAVLRKGSTKGIGLDDVKISQGPCIFDANKDKLKKGLESVNCKFTVDKCGWDGDFKSEVVWLMTSYDTGISKTGPEQDHTSDDNSSSYLFLGGNKKTKTGSSGRMISPSLPIDPRGYCFKFWYHMYGKDMGTLRVRVRLTPTRPPWELTSDYGTILWTRNGDLGNKWQQGFVTIEPNSVDGPFELLIEGVWGKKKTSHMAFDDVQLVLGACTDD